MENYPRESIEIIKQKKKAALLTNKDPSLSHLFDHGGPNTPNSVAADLSQAAAMDVDGAYAEDPNESDNYQLFEGHELSPGSSQLMLNSSNHDTYNKLGKSADISKTDVVESSRLSAVPKQAPKGVVYQIVPDDKSAIHRPRALPDHSSAPAVIWNGNMAREEHAPRVESSDGDRTDHPGSMITITLAQSGQAANFVNSSQGLTTPPADHYNMQLLAYSAQQQQQLLQEQQEQQRQQTEHFGIGSSSDALQQLALKAKLRQEQEAHATYSARAQEKCGAYGKLGGSQSAQMSSGPTAFVQSRKLPANISVSASLGGWSVAGRGTPETIQSQNSNGKLVPAPEIPFVTQDGGPILPLHSSDETGAAQATKLNAVGWFHKPVLPPEPELKSPLDHPEHQLDHQQRARFFSGESVVANQGSEQGLDDEAPLNERDKEAAAALRVLLEQSEKASFAHDGSVKNSLNRPHRASPALLGPAVRFAAAQLMARSTPPPIYDQAFPSPQNIQQLLRPASGSDPRIALIQTLPQSATPTDKDLSSHVKHEPESPAVTSAVVAQHFVPNAAMPLPPGQSMIFPIGNGTSTSASFVIYPVPGQPAPVVRQSDANSSALSYAIVTTAPTITGNSFATAEAATSYLSSEQQPAKSKPVSSNKPASRESRSSSSGSSSRRNSDGSLTCGLCGQTFKSTPALNGHMRVHSSSDKKNKEDRHSKSSSGSDSSAKNPPLPTHQVLHSSPSPAFVEIGRSPPGLVPTAAALDVPPLLHQQYVAQPAAQMPGRSHNGLLTMASAASFLKTDASHPDFMYPSNSMQPTYVMPPAMVLQPAQVPGVFPPNSSDLKDRMGQQLNYPQLYATPVPPAFGAFNLPNAAAISQVPPPLIQQQEVQYLSEDHAVQSEMARNAPDSVQPYAPDQLLHEKTYPYAVADDNYHLTYDMHHMSETNSLSQLASIAVAAANRDQFAEVAPFPAEYASAAYTQPGAASAPADPAVSGVPWAGPAVDASSQDACLVQQDAMYPKASASKTSPIRTGNDPFILPVTTATRRLQSRFGEYEAECVTAHISMNQQPSVTWQDTALFSSYDDPLMRDAVNVASPSKILPNSMMGGTPSCGSWFSSASGRPFRQRHHSEGAHLVKTSNSSILRQILHSPVPSVKLKSAGEGGARETQNPSAAPPTTNNSSGDCSADHQGATGPSEASQTDTAQVEKAAVPEKWAEPMPVTRRIRRRRHSADCRVPLKSGALPVHRQDLHKLASTSGTPMKKSGSLLRSDARIRRKPPPLVIPSSVNAYINPVPAVHFYMSNLHHRRRPSGDSNSSYNGADKIPPYTPPPMISPMRPGSGLYCTTPVTPSAKFHRQLSGDGQSAIPTIPEVDENLDYDDGLIRSTDPKINIGPRFQAVVPNIMPRALATKDKHPADLTWSLPPESVNSSKVHTQLENFMELSCSAAVPFGGSNKAYALDCLFKTNGDILGAVRRLIQKKSNSHTGASDQYLGSGKLWSPQEVELFDRGMNEHRKDFFVISKMVKTRSTFECVERYYHIVKRNKRRVQRPRRYLGDEQQSNVMALLAGTPSDVKRAMRIESADNSSNSSDDEMAINKTLMAQPALPSEVWRARLQSTDPFSPPRIAHVASAGASPQPLPRHSSQPNAQKPLKTHIDRIQHVSMGGRPSPAGSPASTASVEDQPSRTFTCPVCGKSFGKVKSRNAHMKTHGKQAQEKRRQKREEEAARRRGEPPPQQLAMTHVNIPQNNYLVPAAAGLLHAGVVHRPSHVTM